MKLPTLSKRRKENPQTLTKNGPEKFAEKAGQNKTCPEGPGMHLNISMPRGKKIRETNFATQLHSPRGQFAKRKKHLSQRAPNPPEFAEPRLSRVKAQSSPARGYKFGCVCSYMVGHEDAGVVTDHIGTNTPKFVPPRWGRPRFDPTQPGLCKFGRGFGAR